MRLTTALASAAIAISTLGVGALASQGLGVVKAVIGTSSATGPGGARELSAGSVVGPDNLIATGPHGSAQIEFTEGTRIALGGDSTMKIDAIEVNGDAAENQLDIRAILGNFRFKNDESGDKGVSIVTPSATIALSGTAFDFTVTRSGGTRLLLLDGEVTMCGVEEDSVCRTVASPCAMLRTDNGKDVEQVGSVAGTRTGDTAGDVADDEVGLEQEIRENFPYQRSQSDLLEEFRVAGRSCSDAPTGGLAEAPLEQPGLHIPPEIAVPVAAAVVICILLCPSKDGPPVDATNHTN